MHEVSFRYFGFSSSLLLKMDYALLLLCGIAFAMNSVRGNSLDFAKWQTKIEEKIFSLENENRELKHRVDGLESLLKESEIERIRIGNIVKRQQESMRGSDNLQQDQGYPRNQNELQGDKKSSNATHRKCDCGSEHTERRMQGIGNETLIFDSSKFSIIGITGKIVSNYSSLPLPFQCHRLAIQSQRL